MTIYGKHRVYTFLSFSVPFEAGLTKTLNALCLHATHSPDLIHENMRHSPHIANACVPERVNSALFGRYNETKIFENDDTLRGADLFIPAQKLVSGHLKPQQSYFDIEEQVQQKERCKVYKISEQALKFLQKANFYEKETAANDRVNHQLVMLLSKAAKQRIEAELSGQSGYPDDWIIKEGDREIYALPIRIKDIIAYHFKTGQVICQVAMEVDLKQDQCLTSVAFSEMVDHCSRFADLAWVECPRNNKFDAGFSSRKLVKDLKFTLGDLVARLICGPDGLAQRSFRSFTHAYGQVEKNGSETNNKNLSQLATQLARQYNPDYAFKEDAPSVKLISDFDNVVHACALEGSATIVYPFSLTEKKIEFLENYDIRALELSYLPILVLNLHLLVRSLEIRTISLVRNEDASSIEDSKDDLTLQANHFKYLEDSWLALEREFQTLMSCYRFPLISKISMQNSFNQSLHDVFKLEKLEETLQQDLSSMSQSVQTSVALFTKQQRNLFERRFKFIPYLVTSAIVGIFFLDLIIALETLAKDKFTRLEIAGLVSVLVIAFGAGIYNYWRDKRNLDN